MSMRTSGAFEARDCGDLRRVARIRTARRTRKVLTTGSAVLIAAAMVGCTTAQSEPTPGGSTSPTADAAAPVPLSDLPAGSPLDPGRYVAAIDGAPDAPLLPVLSVPEGYTGIGTGVYADDLEGDIGRIVWAWVVNRVYPNPCSAAVEFAETVGPSVADLANALAAQALRAGADPVPVTVGGYDGLYVELSVPDDVNLEACRPEGYFYMWPGRVQQFPGQVDMVWIVDVEGQRIVFDASHFPDASSEEVAELRDMVTTATFEPAEGT